MTCHCTTRTLSAGVPCRCTTRRVKVLLFVQNEGDKRPKCVSWWEAAWVNALMAVVREDPFGSVQFHSFTRARKESDRWWLVEAANAESGRACIGCHPIYGDTGGWPIGVNQHGRILASGGKR